MLGLLGEVVCVHLVVRYLQLVHVCADETKLVCAAIFALGRFARHLRIRLFRWTGFQLLRLLLDDGVHDLRLARR